MLRDLIEAFWLISVGFSGGALVTLLIVNRVMRTVQRAKDKRLCDVYANKFTLACCGSALRSLDTACNGAPQNREVYMAFLAHALSFDDVVLWILDGAGKTNPTEGTQDGKPIR